MGVDLFFHKDEGVAEDFEFFQIMLIDKPVTISHDYYTAITLFMMGGINTDYSNDHYFLLGAARRIKENSIIGRHWLMDLAKNGKSLMLQQNTNPDTRYHFTIKVRNGNHYEPLKGTVIELNHLNGPKALNDNHWGPILYLLGSLSAEGKEYDPSLLREHAEVFETNGFLLADYLEKHASHGRTMTNDLIDGPEAYLRR